MDKDIVLLPGLWMGAWAWEPVTRLLLQDGHNVHTLTLRGLDHTADGADIGLASHVAQVLSVVDDLRDVILVAHSYSGLVAGQVADRAPDRVAHTVFVEASLPHDGKSFLHAFPDRVAAAEQRIIADHDGRWPVPDVADVSAGQGLSAEQAQWLAARLVPHPGGTLTEPAVLGGSLAELHATYVVCTKEHIGGRVSDDVAAMRAEPTWSFRSLDTGLWPMVSAPRDLAAIIAEAASVEGVRSTSPPSRGGRPESG